jgi:hypothetical protein
MAAMWTFMYLAGWGRLAAIIDALIDGSEDGMVAVAIGDNLRYMFVGMPITQ